MNFEHGGNIYARDITYDFSADLNPLGMPESVRKAAAEAVVKSAAYPDPTCGELVKKLALYENIRAENIVCGNGADDLIYRIVHALKPKKAVIAAPTFSEYAKALAEVGCGIAEHRLDERSRFALDESISDRLTESVDMLILCSPNNPTGRLVGRELMSAVCWRCLEKNIVFLCDECFIDLAENGAFNSAKNFMNSNVIVLKAFTKTYAMPGLRLGYALFGSAETAARVRGCGQYWSVSVPAQAAGIAALDETQYVETAKKLICEERSFLAEMLRKNGFTVYPSDADFLLFRCDVPLDELLVKEKILIRNCANFSGLGEGFFRVAVRTHAENEALAAATERVMRCRER